jgi:hypothetical protein
VLSPVAQKVLLVPDEIVKLSNPVDDKVIDSCLELLAAGRPLSEIMSEARRLAAVSQEHPASLQLTVEDARPTAEIARMPRTSVPEHARSKFLMPMIIAGAALLGGLGGTAATAYFTRTAPVTILDRAEAPIAESSLGIALSPTANAERQSSATAADEIKSTEIRALIERGSMFVGSGDLGTARRLYARAAEAGDPQARYTRVRHTTPHSSNERVLEGAHADISKAPFTGTVALAILGQRKPRKC